MFCLILCSQCLEQCMTYRHSICPTFCDPMDYTVHGISRLEYWSGHPLPFPGDLLNPRIKPKSPTLQAGSLLSEPPGKPKNTGVSSLSLLQQIFPNQESNWGLLLCRQIFLPSE